MPTLILSPRYTSDSRLVRTAAERAGWAVVRLADRRMPTWVEDTDLVFYGEPAFADVVAVARGIALLQPTPAWITTLPEAYRRRALRYATLGEVARQTAPAFVKPALEHKPFPAAVYASGAALIAISRTVPDKTPVLISEPIHWDVEVRCFVREGAVTALSPYFRDGKPAQAADGSWPLTLDEREEVQSFSTALLDDPQVSLPPAVALDVGHIADRGWAVVEINSAWGAGIYGCDAGAVLPVLARAAVSQAKLVAADRPWVRMPTHSLTYGRMSIGKGVRLSDEGGCNENDK